MEYYLEQWEELRKLLSGKRPDRVLCAASKLVDEVTGVDGLFGFRPERLTDAEVEAFFDPPSDLATWASRASSEKLQRREREPGAPEGDEGKLVDVEPLPLAGARITFPERAEQRVLTRLRVVLPADAKPGVVEIDGGKESRFTIAGEIEHAGVSFEQFRNRFVVVPSPEPAPIVLVGERRLRPGGPYIVTLEIRDEITGKTSFLSRGFTVPETATAEAEWKPQGAVEVAGSESGLGKMGAKDALVLLPPLSDVVFGLWRAEAIVVGEKIRRVAFFLNGARQLERGAAPWSAEIRLPNLPTELVVRAEGLDEKGNVIAADEVVLNEPQGEPGVRLLSPPRGKRIVGKAVARAAVVVPEGKRVESVEFRLNESVLATLEQPPWEVAFTAPDSEQPVYLTVAATYVDGTRVEDFRVLSGGPFGEQIDVDLVELQATVFDRGRIVENLTEADFTVLDRGKPQKISRFELMRDLPLALGIVLDTSGSMRETIGEAKRAAGDFLAAMVREKDRAFATSFSDRPRLLMPLTADVRAVEIAFRDLPALGNTALHDAIIFSLYQLKGVRGRKALVLLSDGDDTSSLVKYDDALEFARRSGTAIYTIGLDVGATNFGIRGKLEKLADETGGRAFFVAKAAELAGVYAEIERELRSQFLLAFAPDPPGATGVFSPVEVKVKGGLKARAPRGYYP
jgi:VWFA-related protein